MLSQKTAPYAESFSDLVERYADHEGKLPTQFQTSQDACWESFRAAADNFVIQEVYTGWAGHNYGVVGRAHHPAPDYPMRNYGVVVREPKNRFDSNALRVYAVLEPSTEETIHYHSIGYISKDTAEKISIHMDAANVLALRVALSNRFYDVEILVDNC